MELDQYLDALPKNRRARLQQIRELILAMYPDAVESMRYKMPTYEYKEGWISVGNQKHYVSLYTCMEQHILSFKASYPKIKTGKGCINFKDKDPIPLEDLKPVIQSALEYNH